jgi:hypothetical protein
MKHMCVLLPVVLRSPGQWRVILWRLRLKVTRVGHVHGDGGGDSGAAEAALDKRMHSVRRVPAGQTGLHRTGRRIWFKCR